MRLDRFAAEIAVKTTQNYFFINLFLHQSLTFARSRYRSHGDVEFNSRARSEIFANRWFLALLLTLEVIKSIWTPYAFHGDPHFPGVTPPIKLPENGKIGFMVLNDFTGQNVLQLLQKALEKISFWEGSQRDIVKHKNKWTRFPDIFPSVATKYFPNEQSYQACWKLILLPHKSFRDPRPPCSI